MTCRLCLKNSITLQSIISSNIKCSELTLIESVYWVFGVEIDVDDPYSKLICLQCENVIQHVGYYRTLYRRNQLILQQKLNSEQEDQTQDSNTDQLDDIPAQKNDLSYRKRRQFLDYYAKVPTTAIRDLIKEKYLETTDQITKSNVKVDNGPLVQVNGTVEVEVCKYCSQIFKTKYTMDLHYETRHKSPDSGGNLKKRMFKKNRRFFKKRPHQKLIIRRNDVKDWCPSLREVLSRIGIDGHAKKSLLDSKQFPNLNFVKQLDKRKNREFILNKKKEEVRVHNVHSIKEIKQNENDFEDDVSEGNVLDIDMFNDDTEMPDEEIQSVAEIKTVKINDSEQNKMQNVKDLNLKDFYISVERYAVPPEFQEKFIKPKMRNVSPQVETIAPTQYVSGNIFKSSSIQEMKAYISSTLFRLTEIKSVRDKIGESPVSTSNDQMAKTKQNTYIDLLKEQIDIVQNDKGVSGSITTKRESDRQRQSIIEQYKSLNLKEFYIALERCAMPRIFSQIDEVANEKIKNSAPVTLKNQKRLLYKDREDSKNMKHGKEHVSDTLPRMNRIERSRPVKVPGSEIAADSNIGHNMKIVSIRLESEASSRRKQKDIKDQYKWLNLKDFYISMKRCAISPGFYQNNAMLVGTTADKACEKNSDNSCKFEENANRNRNLSEVSMKMQQIEERLKNEEIRLQNQDGGNNPIKSDSIENENEYELNVNSNEGKSVSSRTKRKLNMNLRQAKNKRRKFDNTEYSMDLEKYVKSVNLKDMIVSVPKIDPLLSTMKYNIVTNLTDSEEDSSRNEVSTNFELTPQLAPEALNCMPQLEKQVYTEKILHKDILDEPPKLEPQVDSIPFVRKTDRIASRKKKVTVSSRKKTAHNIKPKANTVRSKANIKRSTISKQIIVRKVHQSKRKKKKKPPCITKEMNLIVQSLCSLKMSGNDENAIDSQEFCFFEGSQINNWKDRIFKGDSGILPEERSVSNASIQGVSETSNDTLLCQERGNKSLKASENLRVTDNVDENLTLQETHQQSLQETKACEDNSEVGDTVDKWKQNILANLLKLSQIKEMLRKPASVETQPTEKEHVFPKDNELSTDLSLQQKSITDQSHLSHTDKLQSQACNEGNKSEMDHTLLDKRVQANEVCLLTGIKQNEHDFEDGGSEGNDLDVDMFNGDAEMPNEEIQSKVEIKTVKITNTEQKRTQTIKDLNLRDFYISVKRCAVTPEFQDEFTKLKMRKSDDTKILNEEVHSKVEIKTVKINDSEQNKTQIIKDLNLKKFCISVTRCAVTPRFQEETIAHKQCVSGNVSNTARIREMKTYLSSILLRLTEIKSGKKKIGEETPVSGTNDGIVKMKQIEKKLPEGSNKLMPNFLQTSNSEQEANTENIENHSDTDNIDKCNNIEQQSLQTNSLKLQPIKERVRELEISETQVTKKECDASPKEDTLNIEGEGQKSNPVSQSHCLVIKESRLETDNEQCQMHHDPVENTTLENPEKSEVADLSVPNVIDESNGMKHNENIENLDNYSIDTNTDRCKKMKMWKVNLQDNLLKLKLIKKKVMGLDNPEVQSIEGKDSEKDQKEMDTLIIVDKKCEKSYVTSPSSSLMRKKSESETTDEDNIIDTDHVLVDTTAAAAVSLHEINSEEFNKSDPREVNVKTDTVNDDFTNVDNPNNIPVSTTSTNIRTTRRIESEKKYFKKISQTKKNIEDKQTESCLKLTEQNYEPLNERKSNGEMDEIDVSLKCNATLTNKNHVLVSSAVIEESKQIPVDDVESSSTGTSCETSDLLMPTHLDGSNSCTEDITKTQKPKETEIVVESDDTGDTKHKGSMEKMNAWRQHLLSTLPKLQQIKQKVDDDWEGQENNEENQQNRNIIYTPLNTVDQPNTKYNETTSDHAKQILVVENTSTISSESCDMSDLSIATPLGDSNNCSSCENFSKIDPQELNVKAYTVNDDLLNIDNLKNMPVTITRRWNIRPTRRKSNRGMDRIDVSVKCSATSTNQNRSLVSGTAIDQSKQTPMEDVESSSTSGSCETSDLLMPAHLDNSNSCAEDNNTKIQKPKETEMVVESDVTEDTKHKGSMEKMKAWRQHLLSTLPKLQQIKQKVDDDREGQENSEENHQNRNVIDTPLNTVDQPNTKYNETTSDHAKQNLVAENTSTTSSESCDTSDLSIATPLDDSNNCNSCKNFSKIDPQQLDVKADTVNDDLLNIDDLKNMPVGITCRYNTRTTRRKSNRGMNRIDVSVKCSATSTNQNRSLVSGTAIDQSKQTPMEDVESSSTSESCETSDLLTPAHLDNSNSCAEDNNTKIQKSKETEMVVESDNTEDKGSMEKMKAWRHHLLSTLPKLQQIKQKVDDVREGQENNEENQQNQHIIDTPLNTVDQPNTKYNKTTSDHAKQNLVAENTSTTSSESCDTSDLSIATPLDDSNHCNSCENFSKIDRELDVKADAVNDDLLNIDDLKNMPVGITRRYNTRTTRRRKSNSVSLKCSATSTNQSRSLVSGTAIEESKQIPVEDIESSSTGRSCETLNALIPAHLDNSNSCTEDNNTKVQESKKTVEQMKAWRQHLSSILPKLRQIKQKVEEKNEVNQQNKDILDTPVDMVDQSKTKHIETTSDQAKQNLLAEGTPATPSKLYETPDLSIAASLGDSSNCKDSVVDSSSDKEKDNSSSNLKHNIKFRWSNLMKIHENETPTVRNMESVSVSRSDLPTV